MASIKNEELVEIFNKQYPIGSVVNLRKAKFLPYKEYKVRGKAYMMSGSPVALFEEISGCFSIEKEFVKY